MLTEAVELMGQGEKLEARIKSMETQVKAAQLLAGGDDGLKNMFIAAIIAADALPVEFIVDAKLTWKEMGTLISDTVRSDPGRIGEYLVAAAVGKVGFLSGSGGGRFSPEEVAEARNLLSKAGIADKLGNLSQQTADIIKRNINDHLKQNHPFYSAD